MGINTILITQARMGSTRLPGKIIKEIDGTPLLKIHLDRLKKCKNVADIIVATTTLDEDLIIYELALEWGYSASRGSSDDVLDRFYKSVVNKSPDWIVRVTSDCPLLDPVLVDKIIDFAIKADLDYCTNTLIENYPDGQDVEVIKFSALKNAWKNSELLSEREHVTPYIRNNSDFKGGNKFSAINFPCQFNFNKIRMTVDEEKDFVLIKQLVKSLGLNKTWLEYTNFIIEEKIDVNNHIIRNEGYFKSINKDIL